MKHITRLTKFPLAAALVTGLLLSGGMAMAQQEGGGEQMQSEQSPQMELQQLQQRLGEIQQQAFENNPELQEQAQELEQLFIDTMSDAGYDPEGGLARLQEIQQEMQAQDADEENRRALLEEAQQIQMELQEGQQVAMQEQVIIDAQQSFEEDLMDAMRAEDPQTDELISRFEQLQQQMQQQMQPGMQ